MGDFDISQMREGLGQRLADQGGNVAREAIAIGFAAAEEQAVVGRGAIVIHHEFAVCDTDPFVQRGPFGQQFGRDDEIVDRHDAGRGLPMQPPEIAVAGQDHLIRDHPPFIGGHQAGGGAMDPTGFMNRDTCRCRYPSQAQSIGERVQMGRAMVEQAASIDICVKHVPKRVAVEDF